MLAFRGLFLAAVVLTAGVLLSSSPARAADLKYLPDDTELVITVNVKQVLDSELVKGQRDALVPAREMLDQLAGAHLAHKYLKGAGFDVFRDLQSITFAYPRGKDLKAAFLVVEGQFDAAKWDAAARANADTIQITESGGVILYEIAPPGKKRMFAGLVNPTTLIAATTKEALTDALARSAGSKASGLKKEFQRLLETTNNRQSMSVVATGAALSLLLDGAALPNAEVAGAFLKSVSAVSGVLTVTGEIQLQLGVTAESEDTAKKLATSANGAVRILRTLTQQKAKEDAKLLPLIDVVKTLRITNQGPTILLRGEASLDVIERLMKNFPVN